MADLQVVYLRDVVPVEGVSLVSLDPPILALKGSRFSVASEVRVNGRKVDFILSDSTTILAGMPPETSVATIDSVEVLGASPAEDTESTKLEFLLTDRPFRVSGLQRMIQTFLKLLFTTPGTNIYNRNQGGGALQMLGTVDGLEASRVTLAFTTAVDRTKEQLLSVQSRSPVPSSERLLDAVLTSSAFDPSTGSLIAKVMLVSFDRQKALANITV